VFLGRKHRGFTLIELLVVIAIIAILAAILFPVFAQARDRARAATCLSNLKQIGSAFIMYAQDYDETYPAAAPGVSGTQGTCAQLKDRSSWGGWVGNLLYPYTKNGQIFTCPSNPKQSVVNNSGTDGTCAAGNDEALAKAKFGTPYLFVSYGFNYVALGGRALSVIPAPANQLVMWDGLSPWADCNYATSSCGIWNYREVPYFLAKLGLPLTPGMNAPTNTTLINQVAPHSNMLNYLYADGHAKASRWDKLTWGNLAGHSIPENNPVYNLSLIQKPPAPFTF
jgi:prepilin-type N-terminal cleavage/methylation domain-containing protein/prepilin-type processing-associated H-X9-DG protein